jgi:hypothetical protein
VLALTFAQPVAPAEVEEKDEDETFGRLHRWQQFGVDAMTPLGACTANRWPPWSRWPGWLNGLPWIAIMAVRFVRNPLLPPTWGDLFPWTAFHGIYPVVGR